MAEKASVLIGWEGLMNIQQRRILVVETASLIRSALRTLLASIHADPGQGLRETLERFCAAAPEKLLLDLRCREAEPGPVSFGITNVTGAFIGCVLVLTIEANTPLAFLEVRQLVNQNFCFANSST